MLKDKDSKEVTRLLSLVASSLLPNPDIGNAIDKTGNESDVIKAVLSEVRTRLRVRENDQSLKAETEIYSFLSKELSKATLTSEVMNNVESRLGSKGELHPSRYEIRFADHMLEHIEATGNRRGNVVEAVLHPDQVIHLKPKYLSEEVDPRITISLKSISTKRDEDRFLLFVCSFRLGRIQYVAYAYRVYLAEVRVENLSDPIDVVRSFANYFGTSFRWGSKVSKFMLHETVTLEGQVSASNPRTLIEILEPETDHQYSAITVGGESMLRGPGGDMVYEAVLGLAIDETKYWSNLRKHRVQVHSDVEVLFRRSAGLRFPFREHNLR